MIDSRTAPLISLAEWLCRTVAQHDLDGTPLYAVPQSRLSAKLGQSCGPFGYTTLDLDLLLKAEIGDAWQGRGACVVVNDAAIIAEALPETAADFCGVALHELAHVLQHPRLFTDRTEPSEPELQTQVRQLATHLSDDSLENPAVPWDRHDLPFIRAFLHLAHRAEQAGYPVCAAAFCAGPLYGLSSAIDDHGLGDYVLDTYDGLYAGDLTGSDDLLHYWSAHQGGVHFSMCDGSVQFLSYSIDHETFLALGSRNGGEVVNGF